MNVSKAATWRRAMPDWWSSWQALRKQNFHGRSTLPRNTQLRLHHLPCQVALPQKRSLQTLRSLIVMESVGNNKKFERRLRLGRHDVLPSRLDLLVVALVDPSELGSCQPKFNGNQIRNKTGNPIMALKACHRSHWQRPLRLTKVLNLHSSSQTGVSIMNLLARSINKSYILKKANCSTAQLVATNSFFDVMF